MDYTPHLIGNEHIQSYLRKTVKNGTVASAQLWLGPEHVGKSTFLINYLFSLGCRQPSKTAEPCLRCAHCRALQSQSHPNVVWLDASDKGIKFDAIRQARADSFHTALHTGVRALVIKHAEMMHVASCNALLKLLEEPSPGLYIVLLATEAKQLPATIISRCLTLHFMAVGEAELAHALPQAARSVVALAQGLPGMAQHFIATPKDAEMWLKTITTWVEIMQTQTFGARLQLAQAWLTQERSGTDTSFKRVLQALSVVLRDVLIIQTETSVEVVAQPHKAALHILAQQRAMSATLAALHAVQTIWQRQYTIPIQKKLVLSNLLLVI